jgi:hypothetical protein
LTIGCALALCAACARTAAGARDVTQRFESPGLAPVDVAIRLQPEHVRDGQRYLRAATSALETCGRWLAPFPQGTLTIVDPPWRGEPADDAGVVVIARAPWGTAPTSMSAEIAVARGVSQRCWALVAPQSGLPAWFSGALVELVARRAVTPLFEMENLSPGFAFAERRYFGGFVPKFVRIRLLAETDGDPLPAYRRRPDVDGSRPLTDPADLASMTAKTFLMLGTLQRWLGTPVFDQVVSEVARRGGRERLTPADFARIASEVSGQDLTWFFAGTLGSSARFDYGIQNIASEPEPDGSFRTTVVVQRYGDGIFSGASDAGDERYPRGRGVTVQTTFADGARQNDTWNGRDRRLELVYRSQARAVSATVDPDRTLLLDLNHTNNSRAVAAHGTRVADRWAARWLIWMQDFMLDYASLI